MELLEDDTREGDSSGNASAEYGWEETNIDAAQHSDDDEYQDNLQ